MGSCGRIGFVGITGTDPIDGPTVSTDASPDTFVSSGAPSFATLGIQTSSGNSNNFVTITCPAGVTAGDLLVAVIGPENSVTVTLAGWSSLINNTHEIVLYKIATAAEPASFTFTAGSNMSFSSGILRITGASQTTPIDSGAGGPTTANSRTAPSLTTSGANELLIGCWGNALGGNQTPPAPMTEVLDNNTSLAAAMCGVEVIATAGATGTRTSTGGGVGPYTGDLIAIRP